MIDYTAQIVTGATIEDLDPIERDRLRRTIEVRYGDRTLLDLDNDELDRELQLVKLENGVLYPMVTGMLLIGKKERIAELLPTAITTFQVLEGNIVKRNEEFSLPLLEVFEKVEFYFKLYNPETETQNGLYRIPIPEFSPNAFREALVNAFSHRDYSRIGSVRIAITDEGMSISSPGGFLEGVNEKNLLTVEPKKRNPTLANTLKRIGIGQRKGRGIETIFEGMLVYARPWPDYSESTSAIVKVFFQRAKASIPFIKMRGDIIMKKKKNLSINSLLILALIEDEGKVGLNRIIEKTNMSENTAKSSVSQLIEAGVIVKVGKKYSYR